MFNVLMLLRHRSVLWMLLIINILGTIYGYIWYADQLKTTPWYFLPFVPDSPTASLFFVLVLIAFLLGRNWPLLEALAAITLFKYGIWAVAMNLVGGYVSGSLTWVNFMLIFSHLGMAIEGLLYTPFYRIKRWHIYSAAVWVIHNEMIDYLFDMEPTYSVLDMYTIQIGYYTFWLSILSIIIVYQLTIRSSSTSRLKIE
ncbi:DUF1405 domain-containing protein [Pseudalkalibacillus salsuginis]|uniref:DUF1405 domain-containing protein n=1 Tax=Pseudalkalibacillus salsuginis TaxID=2910972 RepID=UPI001F457686|nr:DUF1405 domain-containing protein [Pseudalkalibacillus salsuginis]MCF6408219.1 DUF1405 domain-containing protein [Pseudalkalibacillus salsuginis]